MCLNATRDRDVKMAREYRRKGHVLVLGYKVLTSTGRSLCFNHEWVTGWNQAKGGRGKLKSERLRIRSLIRKQSYSSGFHVCLDRGGMELRWMKPWYGNRMTQRVYFYADEVRAADSSVSCREILVNRVLVKKLAKA